MKVSKVDHIKAGVGIQGSETEGILYKNPGMPGHAKQDVGERVKELNSKAQSLYSLFGECKNEKKTVKNVCGILRGYMKNLTGFLVEKNDGEGSDDEVVKRQLEALDKLPEEWIFVTPEKTTINLSHLSIDWKGNKKEEIIDILVHGCLRKSMKRTVRESDETDAVFLPDVIKKLTIAVCAGKDYPAEYGKIPEHDIKIFLKALNEDYTKKKQTAKIVKSIENQDVRVQCVDIDGETRLQISSADNPKKKYIFDFLKEYAFSDEPERGQMLVRMRQLILLFYCGSDTYQISLETGSRVTKDSFGKVYPGESDPISETALELFHQMNSEDKKPAELKKLVSDLKVEIRSTIAGRYRESVLEPGISENDKRWLGYIEQRAESLLSRTKYLDGIKLSKRYLCRKTFAEWCSYIGMKYVDMGKAVFHFAMPDENRVDRAARFGEVRPEFCGGITSFDYERIKAKESLNMDLFSAISFAVGNFDHAARTDEARQERNKEDILQLLNSQSLKLRPDAERDLLQFYGGQGKWEDTVIELYEKEDLVRAIGKELNRIRNAAFHYTGEWADVVSKEDVESREIIQEMFAQEYDRAGYIFRKKFYANNVLMFYGRSDVDGLIEELYARPAKRPAQIPAFGRILNKSTFKEFDFIKGDPKKRLWSSGNDPLSVVGKFENSILFVLKEIYYYGFLQDKNVKGLFNEALKKQTKNEKATKNLQARIKALDPEGKLSFGELCQGIMTDYNQQNNGMKKRPSEKNTNLESQKYKHFRTLLYEGIRQAFCEWLKNKENGNYNKYDFLRSPKWKENWAENNGEEDFCQNGSVHIYDDLKEKADKRQELLSWYTLAHFLNQRQLNLLVGSIKNYITFLSDIDARAANTQNRTEREKTRGERERFESVLEVLDFSKLFCEQITNNMKDYFSDVAAYDEYMSNFVAWKREKHPSLRDFCSQEMKNNYKHPIYGIYYDGENPIVNRNVVLSKMYGNEKLLTACLKGKPVTSMEIVKFYNLENKLGGGSYNKQNGHNVFKEGYCKSEKEQKDLRDYQNQKNRIELVDLVLYSELVNDLMSQLRNWCYMRERDMMYCQMGIHYIGLYYGDEGHRNPWLDELHGDGVDIEKGAVLYQIQAMNSYGLPLYGCDENGNVSDFCQNASTGRKVNAFLNQYCNGDDSIYTAGLCFFENLKEHDAMSAFRNSVDHFNFETGLSRSILNIYGEMYDRFLAYDVKLQKSVPIILKNILLEHFIIANINFDTGTGVSIPKRKNQEEELRNMTDFRFCEKAKSAEDDPVRSDVFTYKYIQGGKEEEVKLAARSTQFVNTVKRLLSYADEKRE